MPLAMTIPTAVDGAAIPLKVAVRLEGGTYDFAADEELSQRLHPAAVELNTNERWSRARLTVDATGDSEDGEITRAALDLGEIDELVDPQTRIVVYADSDPAAAAKRAFLFDGYLTTTILNFAPDAETPEVMASSVLEAIDHHPRSAIRGRYMHARRMDAGVLTDYVQHCPAMPVIFNHNGRPNCYHLATGVTVDGEEIDDVRVFTYEGDPQAKYWRLCDVLQYLMVFHFGPAAVDFGVTDGNGKSRCDPFIAGQLPDALDPVELADENSTVWDDVIRTQCPPLAMTGMRLISQALPLLGRQAGIQFQQVTLNDGGGAPETSIVFWLRGEGGPFSDAGDLTGEREIEKFTARTAPTLRTLYLPVSGTALAAPAPQVEGGRLALDHLSPVNRALRTGDPVLYEVTVGRQTASNSDDSFRPGWEPDAMFGDDLSGTAMTDKIAELKLAKSPTAAGNAATMYDRYDMRGKDHPSYRLVGRLWVLNESGEWGVAADPDDEPNGEVYGRENGGNSVWNAASYIEPYDFHSLCDVPEPTDPTSGEATPWASRRRAIHDLVSLPPDRAKAKPILECSWDEGIHWYPYPGSYVFDKGENGGHDAQIAVLLTDPNLNAVLCDKPQSGDDTPRTTSVWEAIVRGEFRLALTCAIAGDDIVTGLCDVNPWGTVDHHLDLAGRTPNLRKTVIANSMLDGADGWTDPAIDDSERAESEAKTYVAANRARRISGELVIPHATNDWLPGELVGGIQPRGIDFAAATYPVGSRYPEVISVVINNPAAQSTRLVLDDSRLKAKYA